MKYHVVAIEREYASGGQEIGTLLGERLGIPCYGREILRMAAEKKGVDLTYLENIEEKATGSMLYSMYMLANMTTAAGKDNRMTNEGELFVLESEIIRRVTQTPAIIVGRCAVDSLKEREDVLRVFIHADMETRKRRAIEHYNIPPANAGAALKNADRRRSGYYKINTGTNWTDMNQYHMVLDSGLLGINTCVDILESCLKS